MGDDDWKKLEEAGWTVEWGRLLFCHSNWDPQLPAICPDKDRCHGHRAFNSYQEAIKAGDKARFLGSLASAASKRFPSLNEAIEEWERITGGNASDMGCSCCGQPHYFYIED